MILSSFGKYNVMTYITKIIANVQTSTGINEITRDLNNDAINKGSLKT